MTRCKYATPQPILGHGQEPLRVPWNPGAYDAPKEEQFATESERLIKMAQRQIASIPFCPRGGGVSIFAKEAPGALVAHLYCEHCASHHESAPVMLDPTTIPSPTPVDWSQGEHTITCKTDTTGAPEWVRQIKRLLRPGDEISVQYEDGMKVISSDALYCCRHRGASFRAEDLLSISYVLKRARIQRMEHRDNRVAKLNALYTKLTRKEP